MRTEETKQENTTYLTIKEKYARYFDPYMEAPGTSNRIDNLDGVNFDDLSAKFLQIIEKLKNEDNLNYTLLSASYNGLASMADFKENNVEAIKHYELAIAAAAKISEPDTAATQQAIYLINLGRLHFKCGRLKEAESKWEKASSLLGDAMTLSKTCYDLILEQIYFIDFFSAIMDKLNDRDPRENFRESIGYANTLNSPNDDDYFHILRCYTEIRLYNEKIGEDESEEDIYDLTELLEKLDSLKSTKDLHEEDIHYIIKQHSWSAEYFLKSYKNDSKKPELKKHTYHINQCIKLVKFIDPNKNYKVTYDLAKDIFELGGKILKPVVGATVINEDQYTTAREHYYKSINLLAPHNGRMPLIWIFVIKFNLIRTYKNPENHLQEIVKLVSEAFNALEKVKNIDSIVLKYIYQLCDILPESNLHSLFVAIRAIFSSRSDQKSMELFNKYINSLIEKPFDNAVEYETVISIINTAKRSFRSTAFPSNQFKKHILNEVNAERLNKQLSILQKKASEGGDSKSKEEKKSSSKPIPKYNQLKNELVRISKLDRKIQNGESKEIGTILGSDLSELNFSEIQTLFYYAVSNNSAEIINLFIPFIKSQKNIKQVKANLLIALLSATSNGFDDVVRYLISQEANPNCYDEIAKTGSLIDEHLRLRQFTHTHPLLEAIQKGHGICALWLMKDGLCKNLVLEKNSPAVKLALELGFKHVREPKLRSSYSLIIRSLIMYGAIIPNSLHIDFINRDSNNPFTKHLTKVLLKRELELSYKNDKFNLDSIIEKLLVLGHVIIRKPQSNLLFIFNEATVAKIKEQNLPFDGEYELNSKKVTAFLRALENLSLSSDRLGDIVSLLSKTQVSQIQDKEDLPPPSAEAEAEIKHPSQPVPELPPAKSLIPPSAKVEMKLPSPKPADKDDEKEKFGSARPKQAKIKTSAAKKPKSNKKQKKTITNKIKKAVSKKPSDSSLTRDQENIAPVRPSIEPLPMMPKSIKRPKAAAPIATKDEHTKKHSSILTYLSSRPLPASVDIIDSDFNLATKSGSLAALSEIVTLETSSESSPELNATTTESDSDHNPDINSQSTPSSAFGTSDASDSDLDLDSDVDFVRKLQPLDMALIYDSENQGFLTQPPTPEAKPCLSPSAFFTKETSFLKTPVEGMIQIIEAIWQKPQHPEYPVNSEFIINKFAGCLKAALTKDSDATVKLSVLFYKIFADKKINPAALFEALAKLHLLDAIAPELNNVIEDSAQRDLLFIIFDEIYASKNPLLDHAFDYNTAVLGIIVRNQMQSGLSLEVAINNLLSSDKINPFANHHCFDKEDLILGIKNALAKFNYWSPMEVQQPLGSRI